MILTCLGKAKHTIRMNGKIHPTKLLVRDTKEEEKTTATGIIIPSVTKQAAQKGEVVLCGEGTPDIKMVYSVGDIIIYNPHAGIKITVEDEELRLLDEREVYMALG